MGRPKSKATSEKAKPPPKQGRGSKVTKKWTKKTGKLKKKADVAELSTKQRRQQRKKQKEGYDLAMETKLLWEKLRRHDKKTDQKAQLTEEMIQLVTGHVHELAVKHDTARCIQCCLHYGNEEQRTVVFEELKDHVVELSKQKYSKFTVKSLLKYCSSSQRAQILSSLSGHVRKLMRHSEAADIVESAYNEFANAHQRNCLIQEFYGPKFAMFKDAQSHTLSEILQEGPDQKSTIIRHMKDRLLPLIEKGLLKHSILHRVLLEFFTHADETARTEMIESLREHVIHIVHSKEGSRAALQCLWHGTAKDRKVMVKSFKGYVPKVCMEENGHVVMLGVFDCVDDTVLLRKALLSEMVADLEELCDNHFGRRVLLYLLSPRNPQHFSSQFISILSPGDANPHSKKPPEVRYGELRDGITSALLELAGKKAMEWALSKQHAVLLIQIVESATGDLSLIFCPLVDSLATVRDEDDEGLVEHSCGHWVLKRLLNADSNWDAPCGQAHFAELILDRLTEEQLASWASSNRGSFVLTSLLASQVRGIRDRVRVALEGVVDSLGDQPGHQALKNALNS